MDAAESVKREQRTVNRERELLEGTISLEEAEQESLASIHALSDRCAGAMLEHGCPLVRRDQRFRAPGTI
jgi:hypothetical protein